MKIVRYISLFMLVTVLGCGKAEDTSTTGTPQVNKTKTNLFNEPATNVNDIYSVFGLWESYPVVNADGANTTMRVRVKSTLIIANTQCVHSDGTVMYSEIQAELTYTKVKSTSDFESDSEQYSVNTAVENTEILKKGGTKYFCQVMIPKKIFTDPMATSQFGLNMFSFQKIAN